MSDERFALISEFLETVNAFAPAFHQPLQQELLAFFEQENATEGADSLFAQVAAGASPQEADYRQFIARNPYHQPADLRSHLENAAERGWVDLTETGFIANPKAQVFADQLLVLLKTHIEQRSHDRDADIPRLVELLAKVVDTAEQSQAFSPRPNFAFARNYEYEDKSPSLLWARRHMITIGAYRDDAHVAAWRPYGLPGYVWEAFTLVWQDEAHTAAELAEKLAFRSYTEADYTEALEQLAARGWLEVADGGYTLTAAGRREREAAEDVTNQNYMSAFAGLSDAEIREMISLLSALTEAITVREDSQPA